jgi:hypothetical protein
MLPPPRYDPASGEVKTFVRVSYGPKAWQLPIQLVTYPTGADKCRLFLQYLLAGAVCKGFARFTPHLVMQPVNLLHSSSPKILAALQVLLQAGVDSRDTLLAKWKDDPKFLRTQVLALLDHSQHPALVSSWPPSQ